MLELYLIMLCGGDSNVEVDHEHYNIQAGRPTESTIPPPVYCAQLGQVHQAGRLRKIFQSEMCGGLISNIFATPIGPGPAGTML